MKPMNNWLAFSLSPHLGINVGNSTQPHSSELNPHSTMGYQSSAQCYGINSPPTQFSSHISELPLRSDGSLCIMEALGRSHGTADWHSRGVQNEGSGVPSSHLFNTELSRFTSQNGNGDGQFENINMGTEREGPKLEDFLSGASLGNQYQESHTHTHTHTQSQLDTLYYGDTNSNNGNKINVNIPLLHCRQRGDVPPSFHAFGSMGMDSSHSYELVPDSQQLAFNAQLDTNTHDQSVFADCSLQLPPGSGLMGISALKTWLRQNPSDKIPASTNASGSPGSGGGLGDLQALTLSMSPGSQSSSAIVPQSASTDCTVVETRKRGAGKSGSREPVPRKSIDTFGQRTSQYRGVTRHRWTGRYEAHLWDNSCRKEGQTRKGRQVYLGGYDKEEKAARAYDLAALKYWGSSTHINFPLETYEKELEEMKTMSRQEYVANLRRKSSGFSRGASIYRGVTRHHQHGRWQARIGRVAGNKDLYLGTFSTQEEAAEAYDIAAIKFRGISAVTNFDISKYDVKAICSSNTLIAGDLAKRNKDMEHSTEPSNESLLQIEEAAGDNRNSQCSNGNGNGNGNAKDSSNNNSSSNSNVEGSKPNAQDWQFLDSPSDQDQHKVVSNWAEQRQEDRKPDQSFMESLQLGTHSHSAVLHDLIGLDASTGDANNEEASRLLTDISGGNTSLVTTLSNGNGSNTNTINMESPGNSASENEECHRNKLSVYDNMIAAGDFSQALFFSPPQAGSKMVKYENSNNSLSPWMIPPTAVQPLHSKPNNISVGHLPMFALWNE